MDERLIYLLRSGDPEGVEALRRRYGALIRYVADGILRDGRDVEECVSDVYMKIWASAGKLDPDKPLKPYITAVTRNAAVSMLRKKPAEEGELRDNIPGDASPEEEYLRRERAAALTEALKKLSDFDRRLIYRKYYYRQQTARIAAELGMTERAVEGRLYRLRQKLRDALGGETDG